MSPQTVEAPNTVCRCRLRRRRLSGRCMISGGGSGIELHVRRGELWDALIEGAGEVGGDGQACSEDGVQRRQR
eukprot:6338281-Pyramimonas_sp.AAC.1